MTVTPICCEKPQNIWQFIMCMAAPTLISWSAYSASVCLRGHYNRMLRKMPRVLKRIMLKSHAPALKVKPKFWSFRQMAKAFPWCWRKMKWLKSRYDLVKDKNTDTKRRRWSPRFTRLKPHRALPAKSSPVSSKKISRKRSAKRTPSQKTSISGQPWTEKTLRSRV